MGVADESRERILTAAAQEFAQHGIAGARVDRIAASSGLSKPMLYAYFGGKDALFDAVFEVHVVANSRRVPFDGADVPAYVGRLYDEYQADPALLRLVMWKRLEREPEGYLFGDLRDIDDQHLRDIEAQQAAGVLRDDISAEDLWSLVIASATSWAQGSVTVVATSTDTAVEHDRRRAALQDYVGAAIARR